jgi:K(+)-stimulated pyrophosphate-energized sodium pump
MYFNVKEECIAKGCVSTTCKFMNQVACMQQCKKITVEITNDNGTVVGTYTKISNGETTTQTFKELKKR